MRAIDAVREAAAKAGVPITHIGVSMGKARTYVNTAISKNTVPRADSLSAMLHQCGYELAAVKQEDITENMLVIDG